MADPESDGVIYPYYQESVTETPYHFKAITYLASVLEARYADRPNVFVGADNFVFWEKGNPNERRAPDVYVCFGVREGVERVNYKIWEENDVAPQVVFETTSRGTRFNDLGDKKAIYEAIGVEEYYLFDPLGEFIPERFMAFRRKGDSFHRLTQKRVHSPRLGLDLRVEGTLLRMFLPGSGTRLLTYLEAEAARMSSEEHAARLERENQELRRRLEGLAP